MTEQPYKFTAEDLQILQGYRNVVDALGRMFGGCCECVLHSLQDMEHSVIHIHNGSKTGRTVGAPITDKALAMLRLCRETRNDVAGPYQTISRQGHPMRSCTIVIRNTGGIPIGFLCLNFDLHSSLPELCEALGLIASAGASAPGTGEPQPEENFVRDIDDLLLSAACRIRSQVYADDSIPARGKTKAIVLALNREGFFKVRNSVARIAKILKVSRDVVYLHLRNSSAQEN